MPIEFSVTTEKFKIRGTFTISRGSKTVAEVVTVTARDTEHDVIGRGECVPYAHYGESVPQTMEAIEKCFEELKKEPTRAHLLTLLPPGAARNAVDCALWDMEIKRARKLGQPNPLLEFWSEEKRKTMVTAFTLSLKSIEEMGADAKANAHRPLLKLKVGSAEDLKKVDAVHQNAPNAHLIVDANEGWTVEQLHELAPGLAAIGVELVEQPLPAGKDLEPLKGQKFGDMVVCADESMRGRVEDLDAQALSYQSVNIKLDKTGGLTHAIAIARRARELGLGIMVGSMVSTSLSMAPALYLASAFDAEYVDLDGPLLLAEDRENPVLYEGSVAHLPPHELWG